MLIMDLKPRRFKKMKADILHRFSLVCCWCSHSFLDWQQKQSLSVHQGLILFSNPDFTGVSCPAVPAVTISAVAHAVPWNRSWEKRQNWETQITTIQVSTCFLSSHPLGGMCKRETKFCSQYLWGPMYSVQTQSMWRHWYDHIVLLVLFIQHCNLVYTKIIICGSLLR